MLRLRNFCGTCAVFAFCMLLTGFLGGEKPQDAITGIITAINNNDVKAFNERVRATYMEAVLQNFVTANEETVTTLAGGDRKKFNELINIIRENSFLSVMELGVDGGSAFGRRQTQEQKQASKEKYSKRQASLKAMAKDTFQSLFEARVKDGSFSNMCRKLSIAALPFTPEMLKSATVSEPGTGAEKGTATASIILPNNEEVVLGLAEIGKKWVVVTFRGNRKAAADLTVKYRAGLLEQAKMLAERRKNADLYVQEMKASRLAIFEAAKAKDIKALRNILLTIHNKTTDVPSDIKIDSPELLEIVAEQMALCMEEKAADKEPRAFDDEWIAFLQRNNEFAESFLGEVVGQNNKYVFVKTAIFEYDLGDLSVKSNLHEYLIQRREDWLNGVSDREIKGYNYELYRRDGKYLICEVWADERFGTENEEVVRRAPYISLRNDTNDALSEVPFTLTEYFNFLLKNYESLENNAKKIVAKRAKWTEELQGTLKRIDDAIAQKNPEALAALIDLPRFLRDKGTLEQVATATLDNAQSNADIKAFQDSIKAGTTTVFGGPLAGRKARDVGELEALLSDQNRMLLLFEREKASAPWKLVQDTESQFYQRRPENWQAQVDDEMKKIQAQRDQKEREEKAAEEARIAAEEARIAAEKAAEEARIAAEKAAEEARIAEEKAAEEARIAAEEARIAAEKAAEEARIAEENTEKARLAKALEDATPTLTATLNTLADALDKKDPETAQSVLALDILALCPDSNCTDAQYRTLEQKVAPAAGFKRSFEQAVKEGKPLEGFEVLWNTAALRKAALSLPAIPNKANVGTYIATIETKDGPRFIGLTAARDTLLIVTAPQAEQATLVENLVPSQVLFSKIVHYVPAQRKIQLRQLAAHLHAKNAEEAAKFVDFGLVSFWKPGKYDSNMFAALATIALFPDSTITANARMEFIKNCKTTGVFKVGDVEFDANMLENSPINLEDQLIQVVLASSTPYFGMTKNGNLQYIFNASALKDEKLENLSALYRDDMKKIEKEKPEILREAAAQSCFGGVMDTVTFKNATYTLMQVKNNLYLRMKVILTNTNKTPVELRNINIAIYNGDVRRVLNDFSLNNTVTLQPNKPMQVEWSFQPTNGFNMAFLENKNQGWAIRPQVSRMVVGKSDYSYSRGLKPVDKGDGTWQLGAFTPVRPSAPMLRFQEEMEEKLLKNDYAIHEANAEAAYLEALPKLLGKVELKIETVNNELSIAATNNLPRQVHVTKIEGELTENGVITGSVKENWSASVEPGAKSVARLQNQLQKMALSAAEGKGTLDLRVTNMYYDDLEIRAGEAKLVNGFVPPLTFTDNAVISTYDEVTQKAAKPEAAKPEAAKPEAAKPEAAKPEAAKPEAAKPEAVGSVTATGTPTPSANKKPGTAVRGTTAMDVVGLAAFGPDSKADSVIRVSAVGTSPLVGVRIDNMGGTAASWKTKEVKTTAKGVLLVLQEGNPLNPQDTSFSLDVTKPVVLDLLVQDNGALADGKTVLRVVFFHKDGTRSYATLEPTKK